MLYEYLSDTDPENAEPIQEEALMLDVEYFESTDDYYQLIIGIGDATERLWLLYDISHKSESGFIRENHGIP